MEPNTFAEDQGCRVTVMDSKMGSCSEKEEEASFLFTIQQAISQLSEKPYAVEKLIQVADLYDSMAAYESAAVLYRAVQQICPSYPGVREKLQSALIGWNRRPFPPLIVEEGAPSILRGSLDQIEIFHGTRETSVKEGNGRLWGLCTLHGWALSDHGIEKVEVRVDGKSMAEGLCTLDRYDVFKDYPGIKGSSRSGFSIRLNTFQLSDGPHRLEIFVHTPSGHCSLVDAREILVDNSSPCAKNLARITENFSRLDTVLDNYPFKLGISLSSRCNLKCIMCRPDGLQKEETFVGKDMDLNTFRKLKPLIQKAYVIIPQGYGEPMMHPHFDSMLFEIRDLNEDAVVIFTTNGTLISPERAQRLVDARVTFIEISLDSVNPETYASIRKRSTLERVRRNIDGLIAKRDSKGSRYPMLRLKFVLMRLNVHEMPDFVQFAAERGITHIFFNDVEPWYTNAESLMFKHCDYLDYYLRAKELADHYGVFLDGTAIRPFEDLLHKDQMAREDTFSGQDVCPDPFTTMLIETNGDVTVCCFTGGGILGNINEQSIDEVWNGEKYRTLRQGFITGPLAKECAHCMERRIIPKIPSEIDAKQ